MLCGLLPDMSCQYSYHDTLPFCSSAQSTHQPDCTPFCMLPTTCLTRSFSATLPTAALTVLAAADVASLVVVNTPVRSSNSLNCNTKHAEVRLFDGSHGPATICYPYSALDMSNCMHICSLLAYPLAHALHCFAGGFSNGTNGLLGVAGHTVCSASCGQLRNDAVCKLLLHL